MGKKQSSNAVHILHRRYVGDDARRAVSLQQERVNAHVARLIRELREDAGLTQKELAGLIGTTQSVVSRLEDAGYRGHSLSMLGRIATALNRHVRFYVTADQEVEQLRDLFRKLVRDLRLQQELTVSELADKLGVTPEEVTAMERNPGCRPSSSALRRLSEFYGIPLRRLSALAGAAPEIASEVREQAAAYARKSECAAKLTPAEKRLLNSFVSFLRNAEAGR